MALSHLSENQINIGFTSDAETKISEILPSLYVILPCSGSIVPANIAPKQANVRYRTPGIP